MMEVVVTTKDWCLFLHTESLYYTTAFKKLQLKLVCLTTMFTNCLHQLQPDPQLQVETTCLGASFQKRSFKDLFDTEEA